MHHPTERIAHTTAFVKPVVEHWLKRETVNEIHHEDFFLGVGVGVGSL